MFKVRKKPIICYARIATKVEYIQTLEGTMKAEVGDYIITGVKGEHWPVKPDIFDQTYEILK
nr:PGDYG domain-containing protein [Convivina intestini]